ncbi:MAG TPA: hypothetical protein VH796_16480 [Nitrososphaeraceae archaeon]|jgi:hypothetical protein
MSGDPNMETLYKWALCHEGLDLLPSDLENNIEKLIVVVDIVNNCLGKEFEKDKNDFRQTHDRFPKPEEEPFILVPCQEYDSGRKEEFLNCINRSLSESIRGVNEKYQLNLALRLWSSCLATAKTLSLKTQSGINSEEKRRALITKIDDMASTDKIYRSGEEIACMWQPDPTNVNFEGVPASSNARRYESAWAKRGRKRSI